MILPLSEIQKRVQAFEHLLLSQPITAEGRIRVIAGVAMLRKFARQTEDNAIFKNTWESWRGFLLAAAIEVGSNFNSSFVWASLISSFPNSEQLELAFEELMREFFRIDLGARYQLMELIEDIDESGSFAEISLFLGESLFNSTSRYQGLALESTPSSVAQLMVELAAPQSGDTIYDPCFGSANVLMHCAETLKLRYPNQKPRVYGNERDRAAYALGFARLYLADVNCFLKCGDTLENAGSSSLFGQRCDLVLAAPPFGARISPDRYQGNFPISTSDTTLLFLQHIMASLSPGGRAVVCLNDGPLFREQAAQRVRATLLQEFDVESVVALPPGTFAPYTTMKTNLLVFRRHASSGSVRFMLSPALFAVNRRSRKDIETVLPKQVAAELHDAKSDRVWTQPVSELLDRGANLIPRRPEPAEEGDSQFQSWPLARVAEVWSGASYRSQDFVDADDLTNRNASIGLIRVSELQTGRFTGVSSPQVGIPREAVSATHVKRTLQEGDLLVAAVGSNVKVGLVGPEAVGALATLNLIIVRPHERLLPGYLLVVLRSRRFARWFDSHSFGSTVRRIHGRDLGEFSVPLPSFEVQENVARRFQDNAQDLESLLLDWQTNPENGFLWPSLLEIERKIRLQEIGAASSNDAIRFLNIFMREFRPLRDQMINLTLGHQDSLDLDWVRAIEAAAFAWEELDKTPIGPTRLWVLERAARHLQVAHVLLQALELPSGVFKRRFVEALTNLNRSASADLLEQVLVHIKIEQSAAEGEGLVLQVQNQSPLPLRDFGVFLPRLQWQKEIEFLGEGSICEFSLSLPPSIVNDSTEFPMVWEATRLDGKIVDGKGYLSFSDYNAAIEEEKTALGANPYVTGKPIPGRRPDMVFGREEILSEVQTQLSQGDSANVFFYIGNRRAGKTTLLEQQRKSPPEGWIFAFTSFQKAEGENTEALPTNREVFRLIALAIVEELQRQDIEIWPPFSGFVVPEFENRLELKRQLKEALNDAFANTNQPFDLLEEYLRAALDFIAPRRLLLMLDEFDKLAQSIKVGIASESVPENLRYLLQSYSNFTAIIAGSHRLRKLSGGYWASLFGLGIEKNIGCLSREAAQKLVTQPVAGRIRFTNEARDEIVRLCANHAYLIQGFCSQIFNCVKRTGKRLVTVQDVSEVADEVVQKHPFFEGLWIDAETERRRWLMSTCAHFAESIDPLTLDFLLDRLEAEGVRVPRKKNVGDDLKFLSELGVLKLQRGIYSIAIPLLLLWLQSQQDLAQQSEKAREEAEMLI